MTSSWSFDQLSFNILNVVLKNVLNKEKVSVLIIFIDSQLFVQLLNNEHIILDLLLLHCSTC